ncbi:MAG: hypothetical protein ABI824_19570 [Acidobacteriota bacterium]
MKAAPKALFLVGSGLLTAALILSVAPRPSLAQSGTTRTNAAFQRFWAADSPEVASKLAEELAKSGVTFNEAFARLKTGRSYKPQSSGVIQGKNQTSDGVEHYYSINVPLNYDPAHKYQARFQLHGGVGGRSDNKPRGNGEIGQLAGAEQFYVLPYAWDAAGWWSDDQVLNLASITDALKRTYNIDENRVVVSGVSDGGTGAYYIAMRETTPFASFLPLNGFIMVLANQDFDDGRTFPNNLRAKPMFAVNGGLDRLYPIRIVEPYTKHLMAGGVTVDYHPQPDGEHNTRWWPEIKDPFEKFVTAHPRNPYPDQLSWEAVDQMHNRDHWLILDEYGASSGEKHNLPDLNNVDKKEGLGEGELFSRLNPSGRVDLVRKGNTVEASTRHVRAFTLLLSPDQFDFDQPIQVIANGRTVFHAKVTKSVQTLLKWAARDNDRTMLFGAEVQIKLPK